MNYIILFSLSFAIGGGVCFLVLNNFKRKLDLDLKKVKSSLDSSLDKLEQDIQDHKQYKKQVVESLDEEYSHVVEPLESRVEKKSQFLLKRESKLQEIVSKSETEKAELLRIQEKLKGISTNALSELSKISNVDVEDALNDVKKSLQVEMQAYFANEENSLLEHLNNIANKRAQELLKVIMQKYSEPSSTDKLDKFIELISPKEALRVGGKNLENYEYISEKLNVDIEINQYEANIVKVSGFILWKQEIAKNVILKISQLSHIDFTIIDKVIEQSTKEMDTLLINIGRQVAKDINISQQDPNFMNILGRLQYRTSYGQNILFHSFEVGYFSQIIADLLGEDPRIAFLAGFFHDIGKAIDQESEGSHDLLGKEILEKYGFPYEIFHPAHSHHYLVPVETTIGEIVIIADKISAGRPGARAESAEMYYERVQGLERIAHEQEGIKKAFAISAGREIRVYLDENKISDTKMPDIANQIAHQIEDELTYPGQIKVNLIRSVESVDYANKNK